MQDTVYFSFFIWFARVSTFLRVLQNITACVMLTVEYKSHSVSNFHSLKRFFEIVTFLSYDGIKGHNKFLIIMWIKWNWLNQKLTYFLININIELSNTFKSKFFFLYKNPHRIIHKTISYFKNLRWHCCRK